MSAPSTQFKTLSSTELELVRCWRNTPRVSANMFDTSIVEQEQQQRWFQSLQQDQNQKQFVFYQNRRPIGMLSFKAIQSDGLCSWGCYLGETNVWPGSGLVLEAAALDYAFHTLNEPVLWAEVFDFNTSALKMHHFFGYDLVEVKKDFLLREGQAIDLHRFCYRRDDWLQRRLAIHQKMPKQIREAVEKIEFC